MEEETSCSSGATVQQFNMFTCFVIVPPQEVQKAGDYTEGSSHMHTYRKAGPRLEP